MDDRFGPHFDSYKNFLPVIHIKKRTMDMDYEIERILNRQYERMKSELMSINMPQGYLTIISKYWDFAKQDIQGRIMQYGMDENTDGPNN